MAEESLVTNESNETQVFFAKVAQRLKGGDVVGFCGELGSGKTCAIQAILRSFGLGGGESPTFVILKSYNLRRPVRGIYSIVHADAYRLENREEARTTGLTDILGDRRTLVLVEWADRIRALLPGETVWVELRHLGGDRRKISLNWP